MIKNLRYIFICILGVFSLLAVAQSTTVRATIEPSEIMIGEHAVISLEVITPLDRDIMFPVFDNFIVNGLEVVGMLPTDTVLTEVMTLRQHYVVTSFDSMLYHVPYMAVLENGIDTLRSNDIGLKVSLPDLSEATLQYLDEINAGKVENADFDKLGIHDIKDILKVPFVLTDYLYYLLYLLIPLGILFLIAIIVIIIMLIRNKYKKGYFITPKPILPPHVIAEQALDKLKKESLLEQGHEKEFYTQLTDILREYIAARYNISAPEMISEDILRAVASQTDAPQSSTSSLQQILTLADLVKFAKLQPLTSENEMNLMSAYLFVSQTKQEEELKEEDKEKMQKALENEEKEQEIKEKKK